MSVQPWMIDAQARAEVQQIIPRTRNSDSLCLDYHTLSTPTDDTPAQKGNLSGQAHPHQNPRREYNIERKTAFCCLFVRLPRADHHLSFLVPVCNTGYKAPDKINHLPPIVQKWSQFSYLILQIPSRNSETGSPFAASDESRVGVRARHQYRNAKLHPRSSAIMSSPSVPVRCPSQHPSINENNIQKQIASRRSANTAQTPDAGRISVPAEPLASAAVHSRAPPTAKQPRANTSVKTVISPTRCHSLSALTSVDQSTMAAAISPRPTADAPKISMTSKEWVIPPRPKPGRKPATDTPPTKRKAQNRAAQRAFRERRAARVGELELLLDEQKETQQQHEKNLVDKIRSLELDLQSFRSRCMLLESMLDRERQERIRAETQVETLKNRPVNGTFRSDGRSNSRQSHHQLHSPSDKQHHDHLAHTRHDDLEQSRNLSIPQIITPPESLDVGAYNADTDAVITCGNCSPNGRCACAEEVLASASAGCGKCDFGSPCQCLDEITATTTHPDSELKRPASPSGVVSDLKRQKFHGETELRSETDFTMVSRKSGSSTAPQSFKPASI